MIGAYDHLLDMEVEYVILNYEFMVKINLMMLILNTITNIVAYIFVWRALIKDMENELWINRTLFLVVPLEIIYNVKKIHEYFLSATSQ